jgi:hypothetical protein
MIIPRSSVQISRRICKSVVEATEIIHVPRFLDRGGVGKVSLMRVSSKTRVEMNELRIKTIFLECELKVSSP